MASFQIDFELSSASGFWRNERKEGVGGERSANVMEETIVRYENETVGKGKEKEKGERETEWKT